MGSADKPLPKLKDKDRNVMINIAVNKLPHDINKALDSPKNYMEHLRKHRQSADTIYKEAKME